MSDAACLAEAFIEQSPACHWFVTTAGVFHSVYGDPSFLFGKPASELVGRPAAEALELLAAAARLAPNAPAVPAETGKILLSEGQPAAALQEFGRALALDPRDARNFNNRGVALYALEQTEAARQDFERALRIAPSLTEARQNLEKLPAPGR